MKHFSFVFLLLTFIYGVNVSTQAQTWGGTPNAVRLTYTNPLPASQTKTYNAAGQLVTPPYNGPYARNRTTTYYVYTKDSILIDSVKYIDLQSYTHFTDAFSNCYKDTLIIRVVHITFNRATTPISDVHTFEGSYHINVDYVKQQQALTSFAVSQNFTYVLDSAVFAIENGLTEKITFVISRAMDWSALIYYYTNPLSGINISNNYLLSNFFCLGDTVKYKCGMANVDKLTLSYTVNSSTALNTIDEPWQSYTVPLTYVSHGLNAVSPSWMQNIYSRPLIFDTINDPSFASNKAYTKYSFVLHHKACDNQQDTLNKLSIYNTNTIYIYKPLVNIPYSLNHICQKGNLGAIVLSPQNRHGGYLGHAYISPYISQKTPSHVSYVIYKDDVYDKNFQFQCAYEFTRGKISATATSTIGNLPQGDYEIWLSMNDTVFNTNGTVNSIILKSCSGMIKYRFSINEENITPPLGNDRILCPNSSVTLQIPREYTIAPASTVWGTVYCTPNPAFAVKINDSTKIIKNRGGGYHMVTITTKQGCILKDTVLVADLWDSSQVFKLPTALASNAVKYNSGWSTQFSTIQWEDTSDLLAFATANTYFNGSSGIFRPSKSYDYADTLTSSANMTIADAYSASSSYLKDISIRNTGNIADYRFFNYGNPLYTDCASNWVLNNQMTGYTPSGYDNENRDILGIYSAALYGYRDMLPVAVAANAQADEIGYEGFEEYTPQTFETATQLNNATGNFDIIKQTESTFMPKMKEYEIIRAFNRYALIKGNICTNCDEPFKAQVFAQSVPYDIRNERIQELSVTSNSTQIMASPCGDSTYSIVRLDENLPSDKQEFRCRFWAGKLGIIKQRYIPQLGPFAMILDNQIAHSGTYSLKLPANERIILPQVDLELEPKKTYYLGAWIHHQSMYTQSPDNVRYTAENDSIGVLVILPNNEKIFLIPEGEIIEGWQRLEGSFTMPAGTRTEIKLGFVAKSSFNLDDIRLYPQNSAIQSYVYSPLNYKVRCTLDQNNYATFYEYDDEGNLFALKKETVKGIKTIQISNSHIKSSKP